MKTVVIYFTGRLSDYPLDEEAEVVACVDVVGEEPGTAFFWRTRITFTVRDQGSVWPEETGSILVMSQLTDLYDIDQGVEAANLLVETDLLRLQISFLRGVKVTVSFEDIIR